jgi:predicted O-linked N-acetylglucosamine transferase (SPINDLY family)
MLGELEEALRCYRSALALQPDLLPAHTGLLLAMHYSDGTTPQETLAQSRRFAERLPHGPAPTADRLRPSQAMGRLRVGYVSPDFREHSVAWFLEPLLAAHDRQAFEVIGYASVARPDAVTRRLLSHCHRACEVHDLSDEQLAALVREHRVDILVDLAGHTRGNRLGAFARWPAPVQVTYLGYPGTTGVPAIAYRLTDAIADPAGVTDADHSERLVRLPHGFLCYRPPSEAPPVSPGPVERAGQITFACFNNRPKITEAAVALWARLLRELPGSRLVLKSAGLSDAGGRARLLAQFDRHGIGAERLALWGMVRSPWEHLAYYAQADIALDTFPYNGTTTTCEALYMGVPVVTLAGRSHAARVGASLLTRVGLPELIAGSPDEYVACAVALAQDRARLRGLRAGLRDRLLRSPLCDAALITRSIEDAYRAMWLAEAERARTSS